SRDWSSDVCSSDLPIFCVEREKLPVLSLKPKVSISFAALKRITLARIIGFPSSATAIPLISDCAEILTKSMVKSKHKYFINIFNNRLLLKGNLYLQTADT